MILHPHLTTKVEKADPKPLLSRSRTRSYRPREPPNHMPPTLQMRKPEPSSVLSRFEPGS
ncbi:hypothetical protein FOXB_06838 [Fusarium oxysporum f. sp. conglutinans Fo5176]|uniref:Uncharacterized protein n=1 Tax=Fusarium oxysporum (strain Fo5176) TaxID=660025 RepID=F9FKA9_FUSOF|nr:hypothetical protein FOXB_06838 [Fusarium oxysporum f. sp. conglutinans Fo5176]